MTIEVDPFPGEPGTVVHNNAGNIAVKLLDGTWLTCSSQGWFNLASDTMEVNPAWALQWCNGLPPEDQFSAWKAHGTWKERLL